MNKQQNKAVVQNATKTAALYVRLAAAAQQTEGQDLLAFQQQRCEKVADKLGVTSFEVFCDAGRSANDLTRPGYVGLLEYLRRRKPTYLIVTNGDRLSRNARNMRALLSELRDLGIRLVSDSQMPELHTLRWWDAEGPHRLSETR